jgi:hypothetical protein
MLSTRDLSFARSASSFLTSSVPLGPSLPRAGGWAASWAAQNVAAKMPAMKYRYFIEQILQW